MHPNSLVQNGVLFPTTSLPAFLEEDVATHLATDTVVNEGKDVLLLSVAEVNSFG